MARSSTQPRGGTGRRFPSAVNRPQPRVAGRRAPGRKQTTTRRPSSLRRLPSFGRSKPQSRTDKLMSTAGSLAKRGPRPKSKKAPTAMALAAAGAIGVALTRRRRNGAADEPIGPTPEQGAPDSSAPGPLHENPPAPSRGAGNEGAADTAEPQKGKS